MSHTSMLAVVPMTARNILRQTLDATYTALGILLLLPILLALLVSGRKADLDL